MQNRHEFAHGMVFVNTGLLGGLPEVRTGRVKDTVSWRPRSMSHVPSVPDRARPRCLVMPKMGRAPGGPQ